MTAAAEKNLKANKLAAAQQRMNNFFWLVKIEAYTFLSYIK